MTYKFTTADDRRRFERRWAQRKLRRARARTYYGSLLAPQPLKRGRILHIFCGPHAFGYGRI